MKKYGAIILLITFLSTSSAHAQSAGSILATGVSCALTNSGVKSFVNDAVNAGLAAAETIIPGISQVASFLGIGGDKQVQDKPTEKSIGFIEKKEKCLDKIAYTAAQAVLQQTTQKTLNWVNKGFNGNPLYVRDVDSYLKSIKDEKLASYLKDVPKSDPIFGNALRSAITQQVTGRSDGRISQPMNTPEGRAYQDFQSDFTKGGWNALLNMNNNPIGAYFNATDNITTQIDTAQQNIKDELVQGSGFLSMKKCAEYGTGTECLRYETVTPGSIIAEQVATITNTPVRKLEQADELNEILGAFFDKLLNNLFSKGLGALKGGTNQVAYDGSGPGGNVIIGSTGQLISSVTGDGLFGYETADGNGIGDDFDITRPQLLRTLLKIQKDYYNQILDSQIVMNRVVPRVGALDYCFPGPNPTWPEGFEDNYEAFIGSLQLSNPAAAGILGIPFIYRASPQTRLVDKVTDSAQKISPYTYIIDDGGPSLAEYFQDPVNKLLADYKNTYSIDVLTNAYVAAASSPADEIYARGFVRQAYNTTGNLINYNNAVKEFNRQYSADQDLTDNAVRELESIYSEVSQIVGAAKTRYEREQTTAGTPINRRCLNQAYVIDTSPVVGAPRMESNTPNPIIQQSSDATTFFYNNL